MFALLDRSADLLSRLMAYLGGAILLAITAMTCISIIGRAFTPLDIGLGPIRGIYDITEIGMAAAVFAFLPWCQYMRGHATVDLFAPVIPTRMNLFLDFVFDIAMFAAAAVGAWRLSLGMSDKLSYGETTLIAQIPVWQGYAASMAGAVAFAAVAAFCILRSGRRLLGIDENAPQHV
ncbi:MAG: TRAP transporter small permease subunit [Pseudomonadota bacterium]